MCKRVKYILMVLVFLYVETIFAEEIYDPTRPANIKVQAPQSSHAQVWILQAILKTPSHVSALVNDQYVSAGDMISGARIESISEYEVLLNYRGEKKTLSMQSKSTQFQMIPIDKVDK